MLQIIKLIAINQNLKFFFSTKAACWPNGRVVVKTLEGEIQPNMNEKYLTGMLNHKQGHASNIFRNFQKSN